MRFDELILAVKAALFPRITALGGVLEEAKTLAQAHAFLAAAPNRWRVVLHWEGFGEHAEARNGMTIHQVATVIQQPAGLVNKPGLTAPLGQVAFSERINQVVALMTALRCPNGSGGDPAGFVLAGSAWLDLPTTPATDIHTINWRLDAAIPAHSQNIVLPFANLTA